MMTLIRPLLVAALLIGCTVHAGAQSGGHPVLDAWYAALFAADRQKLDALLAPDASIVLEDIGITQTKAEFLGSLEEWADAIDGADLSWRLDAGEPSGASAATALVCYRFADNALMTRERFAFSGGRVRSSTQLPAGDACEGF